MTLKRFFLLLVAMFLAVSLSACGGKKPDDLQGGDALGKTLATVNGVPITEYDVKQGMRRASHDGETNADASKNVLETLVRNELVYQRSVELGLDRNPAYRKKLQEAEAQLRAFQRQEMFALYRGYVRSQANVSDAEAKEFFERNSERIRTKVHVWQIYYRGEESRIAKDHEDLRKGMPFEKVAARRFPALPKGIKAPWDIGFLHWSQIPPAWQAALDAMKPGDVSDILRGPGERFWVIKLVGKTLDPQVSFDTEKGRIVAMLQREKADQLYADMLGQWKAKAKIVYVK